MLSLLVPTGAQAQLRLAVTVAADGVATAMLAGDKVSSQLVDFD